MRVTTINGGFRGTRFARMGAITTAQQTAALEQIGIALDEFFRTGDRVLAAVSARAIPEADATRLLASWDALNDQYAAAITDGINAVRNEAELAQWRSDVEQTIIRPANAWVDTAVVILGDEAAIRPWKVALAVGGALALGAGVVWLVRRGRR